MPTMRRRRTCLVGLLTALLAGVAPFAPWRAVPRKPGHSPDANIEQASLPTADLAGVVLPGDRVISPVAWDIDRDGDLDVVGSTVQEAVVIWINDGRGHFVRQHHAGGPVSLTGSGNIQADTSTALLAAPSSPRWWNAIPAARRLGVLSSASSLLRSDAFVAVRDPASASQPARAPPAFSPLT